MEAEGPQHGASTPNTVIEDFRISPKAIMRSSQVPALEPETQGQDPSYKWTDRHTPLVNQPKELRAMSHCTPGSAPFFFKEDSSDVETIQGDFVSEAYDTPEHQEAASHSLKDRLARTLALPELWTYAFQGKCLDIANELDGRMDMALKPELAAFTLGTGQAGEEEETSLYTSAHTGLRPPCEKHPVETYQSEGSGSEPLWQGKQLQLKENQGQGLVQLQEAQWLEEHEQHEVEFQEEGTLREDSCSDGLWGEQEEMVEQVNGKEEQQQKWKQVQDFMTLVGQREREGLGRETESLNYGELGQEDKNRKAQGQRAPEEGGQGGQELREAEELGRVSQYAENQSSVRKAEDVSGKQDHGQTGKAMSLGDQEEVVDSGEEEREDGKRGGQGAVEAWGTEDNREHCSPSPVALVASEVLSPGVLFPDVSCQTPGVQRDPVPEELIHRTPTPTLEPVGRSSQSISLPGSFATEESLNNRMAHNSQQEGLKETEAFSASTSVTPPRTPESVPFSPDEVTLITANSPVAFPRREILTASLSTDSPSPCGASETPPTTKDPCARVANSYSPSASYTGAAQHLRSNSFPGSHRKEQTPDLLGLSLSFSHLELPQRPPKPVIYGSVIPRRGRRSRDCIVTSESSAALSPLRQDSEEFTSNPEKPRNLHGSQPWGSPRNSGFATGSSTNGSSPSTVSVDMRIYEPLPPPPLEKRHGHSSTVERVGPLRVVAPMLKRHSHPPLALSSGLHGPPRGPFPQVPDPLLAKQHRPLPSTPDSPHHTPSIPSSLRCNKPLPPTPDFPQFPHSTISNSSISRIYRPLPPVPIVDPSSEPPPLPPKTRVRSRSTLGGVMNSRGQSKPRPTGHDWTVSTPLSAGRTSWPPATGRSTETVAPTNRAKTEASPGLAFSNMTNLLNPSSPTTPWTPELQKPTSKDEPGLTEESEAPMKGLLRRSAPQEGASDPRRSALVLTKQPEKPSHPQLEKASSWPHRRDSGRTENSSEQADLGHGPSKHKGWNRQGLRRPSILPENSSDSRGPTMGRVGPSDSVVFREKKSKEGGGGFSRRCSKLINSSQLLYQEYSDVVLNKEIQSQQRLDHLAEAPGPNSPRQPRKALATSDSYVQRLSMASRASLWQEIPLVRNSTILLSMTHEDQKLQEAKFELIMSEASYLRSLNIAVDHFQHSAQLRLTLSTQDHQWLFSRLQDVRDVSTTFLSDLEENFENDIFSFKVCDVVLNHAPEFRRVYLPYVTNQTYQERTFQSLMNSNSSFREVLEKLESDPICQRLSLKSFLILPFQRITRLKLLLQNILKRTQPGSLEEAEATKAHHALEKLIRDCNNNVQSMRRTEELIYLSQKIEFECKIFPLISQSRWLVKSGELTALEFSVSPGLRRKLNTRPVHLHLFNDCLLLSRPREGSRFLVFDHAPFSCIRGEKCEMKLHGPHKNLFRLFLRHNAQGTQTEFLFRTETQSEKLRWISALAMPREELDLLECYDSPQVQCLRAYKPRENDELALEKADVVMVTQQSSDGWLEGVRLSDGEQGWFPLQQVEFISNPEVRAQNLKEAHRIKTAKLQLVEQQV
uniref:Rho guanine nucleotide exchange factor 5 n=1 Tax=Nannospalax galili TaxID=1026970 RepID=A0A8C6QDU0_NANGA